MRDNFFIGIPFIKNTKLLYDAIGSLGEYKENVLLYDNSIYDYSISSFPFSLYNIVRPTILTTFSQTINSFNSMAYKDGMPFWFFMHSDVFLKDVSVISLLLKMAQDKLQNGESWNAIGGNYDRFCVINTKSFIKSGGFDTNFPWYYSDVEYYYRSEYYGFPLIDLKLDSVEHHNNGSQTIAVDGDLRFFKENIYEFWATEYYKKKWGATLDSTVSQFVLRYLLPFNGELNTFKLKYGGFDGGDKKLIAKLELLRYVIRYNKYNKILVLNDNLIMQLIDLLDYTGRVYSVRDTSELDTVWVNGATCDMDFSLVDTVVFNCKGLPDIVLPDNFIKKTLPFMNEHDLHLFERK